MSHPASPPLASPASASPAPASPAAAAAHKGWTLVLSSVGLFMAALDTLRDKNLVYTFHGSTSRVVKYKHMFPNVFELDAAEVAVMAVLMLRGPQTVGELRGRTDRLHEFAGLPEVQETLDKLAHRDEPLIVRLERQVGQKDARYAHLLSGAIDVANLPVARESTVSRGQSERMENLEAEIERLKTELTAFRAEFAEFRKQFD